MHVSGTGMVLIAIAATLTVGCSQDEPRTEGARVLGNAAAGRRVYREACNKCHGQDGRGSGGLTGGNFVDEKSRLAKSDTELIEIIKEGKKGKIGTMPAHEDLLTDQQIRDVLAYIRATYGD